MADTKISGLSAGAPAQATDLIPIARSGANYSITPANILAYGSSPVSATTGTFSGVVSLAAGTVAAPSIYLSTDTTSGLYRIGANNDGFAISGAKVLDIASTGLAVTGTLSGSTVLVGTTTYDSAGASVLYALGTTVGAAMLAKNTAGVSANTVVIWNATTTTDNLFLSFATETSITPRGGIDYNRAGGLVRYNTSSDANLKNIIGDAPQDKSLSILSNTRLREFSWKSDVSNKPQIGVIAQELMEVFPGAVSVGGEYKTEDAEGNGVTKYKEWAVDKTAYQYHLVAGWQSHESKITALEARLAKLEAK